jgi:hypothetical protein
MNINAVKIVTSFVTILQYFESLGYLICLFLAYFFKTADAEVTGSKSSSEDKTEFVPIFRSGSCAERGPKQYMEDEHICIDDLNQHIGSPSNIPFPGAFYGVCMLFLPKFTVYILLSR